MESSEKDVKALMAAACREWSNLSKICYTLQKGFKRRLFADTVEYPKLSKKYWWAKSKTSVFATDRIWVTFSVVLNFLLLGWTPWMGFQNERLECFHNRQKWHGHSWACCYSNTICKCDGRNRLFLFFRLSHFKDCVAIAMCFIVALLFLFLIEVRVLLYCVVYSQC